MENKIDIILIGGPSDGKLLQIERMVDFMMTRCIDENRYKIAYYKHQKDNVFVFDRIEDPD